MHWKEAIFAAGARAILGSILLTCGLDIAHAAEGATGSRPQAFRIGDALLIAGPLQHNAYSGRQVELAVGGDNHAYVASFQRPNPDGAMHVLIQKQSPDGGVAWQRGENAMGRATSLTLTSTDDVWVVGEVQGGFDRQPDEAASKERSRAFLARFDKDGSPKQARYGPEGVVPELVRSGSDGSLLIVGSGPGQFTWDDQRIDGSGGETRGFLALFDEAGVCQRLRPIEGKVSVEQCVALIDGGFVLGGSYIERMSYFGPRLETTGPLDSNAFLMRVDNQANLAWIKSLGEPGNLQKGRRSRESVDDIVVSSSGVIVTAGLRDWPGKNRDRLIIEAYNGRGRHQFTHGVNANVHPPAGIALALSEGDEFLLTYCAAESGAGEASPDAKAELVLLHFTETGIIRSHQLMTNVNTMFQSAAVSGRILWLAGHFQSEFRWGDKQVANDGVLQLLTLTQPLD